MNDNELIHETPGSTPDFKTELAAQLAELMPEVVADGKIDVIKFRELLGEDVGSDTERFGLFWPGKKRALRAAQEPTSATLRPDKANSKDWDSTQNVFIEGDNLEVLKILQKHYHNKIKLIYIDPPYNTGKDFVYPDNYKEGLETYLEWTRQVNEEGKKVSTNSESEGRYHSNWLNMMYPRLKLARNLLTDDGVIAVHIDEHEHTNLHRVLTEIFGESNDLGTVVWDKRNPKGEVVGVGQQHEYIVLFSRNREALGKAGGLLRRKENAETILAKANQIVQKAGGVTSDAREQFREWMNHQKGKFSGGELAYCHIDDNGDVFRPVSMAAPDKPETRSHRPLLHPVTGKPCPVPAKGWRSPDQTMDQLLANGLIVFGEDETTQPNRKYLLKENLFENQASVIYFGGSDELDGVPFDNPKPVFIVKKIIEACGSQTGIVLDFFAGSGTVADAVMSLNAEDGGTRQFFQIQLPEPTPEKSRARNSGFATIAEICRHRINIRGSKIKSPTVDVGFRSFVLADSSFSKWRGSSDTDRTALEQHLFSLRESASDNATPDDLLVEVLLKQGYSLTEKISDSKIAGLEVRIVGDNLVAAYLTESVKPTLDQVRAIVDQAPARIIMLEDAFQGDDELKTNLAQLCKSKGIELWTA